MKRISRRLLGHRGSSMFLAMVFFLLCFFVGGSVLAAATANAGRLSHSRQTQQAYYAQRSAVSLLREQFADPARVTIQLITEEKRTISSPNGNTTVTTAYSYSLKSIGSTISGVANENVYFGDQNNLQQIISKAVVDAYKNNNPNDNCVNGGQQGSLGNVTGGDVTGSFNIQLNDSSSTVTVEYTVDYTDKTDFGDVTFTVYSSDKSDSEFCLVVPASVNVVKSVGSTQSASGSTVTITRTTTESVIVSWGSPVIQKGGSTT